MERFYLKNKRQATTQSQILTTASKMSQNQDHAGGTYVDSILLRCNYIDKTLIAASTLTTTPIDLTANILIEQMQAFIADPSCIKDPKLRWQIKDRARHLANAMEKSLNAKASSSDPKNALIMPTSTTKSTLARITTEVLRFSFLECSPAALIFVEGPGVSSDLCWSSDEPSSYTPDSAICSSAREYCVHDWAR